MFRKLILGSILSVGAIAGLAFTPVTAEAHERPIHRGHRHFDRFEVRVRHRDSWEVHDTFRNRLEARREADRLRHRGLIVEIRACD